MAAPPHVLAGGALPDEPWADHGRAVIVVNGPTRSHVSLVEGTTGATVDMGAGVAAAGVPDARAVVVAVPHSRVATHDSGPPLWTATRVELREAGKRAVVLQTSADLARETHLPAGEPLVVERISVSPGGDRVLVAVDLAGSHEYVNGTFALPRIRPAAGFVVLDRQGKVVAVSPSLPGRGIDWVRWSSGGTLALGTSAITPTVNFPARLLTYWDLRSAPVEVVLAGAFENVLATPCVWSPSAERLLCGDERGWYDVDPLRRRSTKLSPVTGRPLAWLE